MNSSLLIITVNVCTMYSSVVDWGAGVIKKKKRKEKQKNIIVTSLLIQKRWPFIVGIMEFTYFVSFP